MTEKEAALRSIVRELSSCIVAFSGGVDSAVVLAVALQELGYEKVRAVVGVSPSMPRRERAGAEALAAEIGAQLEWLETFEMQDDRYASNPRNRCFFCKNELYRRLCDRAAEAGFNAVADGFNADDVRDYRPGRRAAELYSICSPLAQAGFTKADVRALARRLGLSAADKPSLACLSSRIPYGTPVTREALAQIDQAEEVMIAQGFDVCRVRHHGDVARIELPPERFADFINAKDQIIERMKRAGFTYVALDLEGFRSGSMNEPLARDGVISLL